MAGGQPHSHPFVATKGQLLLQAALGLGAGIGWLIALGGFQQLDEALGAGFVVLVILTFGALHVVLQRPRRWHYSRLGTFKPAWAAPSLVLVLSLTALQISLFLQFGAAPSAPVATLSGNADSTWVLVFAAVFAAPLIEEFGFRLWLQSPLESLVTPWLAIAVSTLIFTAVHGLEGWYSHMLSGFCYGLALWLSQSIWLPVFMHAASNATIALLDANDAVTAILRHWMQADAHLLVMASGVLAIVTLVVGRYWVQQLGRSNAINS